MPRLKIINEIRDGTRCAVCEQSFTDDPSPRFYLHGQGVMVHDHCWEGEPSHD